MIRLVLALLFLPALAWAAPERVVSLNLCADQYLVRLSPARIAALTPLARDPAVSAVAAQARRLPWVRADAEAVLRLHPDLVLAGRYAARATAAALRAQGVTVEMLDDPQDFVAIRAQTLRLAALLDARPAADRWLAAMDAELAGHRDTGRRVVIWQARGWTAGPGSLGDAVLRAAGDSDAGTGGTLGLEVLVAHPPDLLVVDQAPAYPSLATDLAGNPALAAIPRVEVPAPLLICGTPDTARAVALLAQ